jgi:uncharacterized protein (DUF1800 family)
VLGRFGDMLKAVEQHPAMLFFLDNQQRSVRIARRKTAPRPQRKSRARDPGTTHARRRRRLFAGGRRRGEHHHGWTYAARQLGAPGSFVFNANAHQPARSGDGQIYEAVAWRRASGASRYRARHPSTTEISPKFVRHFVADDPPQAR